MEIFLKIRINYINGKSNSSCPCKVFPSSPFQPTNPQLFTFFYQFNYENCKCTVRLTPLKTCRSTFSKQKPSSQHTPTQTRTLKKRKEKRVRILTVFLRLSHSFFSFCFTILSLFLLFLLSHSHNLLSLNSYFQLFFSHMWCVYVK